MAQDIPYYCSAMLDEGAWLHMDGTSSAPCIALLAKEDVNEGEAA